MLKLYKTKGLSLVELMVALSLGIILVFSMLAFYSVTQQNVVAFNQVNAEQQSIRKMLSLLAKDLENTGGFECANTENIFKNSYYKGTITLSAYSSLYQKLGYLEGSNYQFIDSPYQAKQITFTYPITEDALNHNLGLMQVKTKNFAPMAISAGCGEDTNTPMYIGMTVLELSQLKSIQLATQATDTTVNNQDIETLIMMSGYQARQEGDGSDDIKLNELSPADPAYIPLINDGTVLYMSNKNDDTSVPLNRVDFTMLLGFASTDQSAFVPNRVANDANKIFGDNSNDNGGWVDPYESLDMFKKITEISPETHNILAPNFYMHQTMDREERDLGGTINWQRYGNERQFLTYPLSDTAIKRIRAVKFQFTFDADDPEKSRTITRVIRLKNMHLMKLADEVSED